MATVTLPRGPSTPSVIQAAMTLTPGNRMRRLRARFGDAFRVKLPHIEHALVISDPAEVKQLLQSGPDSVDNLSLNLSRVLGPGSMFALTGEKHHRQRRLLVPPFHGRRLAAYETIVEDETVRELATWPQDRPLPAMPSMMRITLNAILRTVFGAKGTELAELRELLPRMVVLGSRLASLPIPDVGRGWWSPWGRFWAMRRRYDAIVERMLAAAAADAELDGRDDILAMMLQSRYEDGGRMSHSEIADQLLTLLSAGHETTATTLAWTVERLRRHPGALRDLVAEVDAGGSALRQATIIEVQRTRPVVEVVARQVVADSLQLGRWTLPRGCAVIVSITLMHDDDSLFPDAATFDPYRFVDAKPDLYEWIPFGGGTRRCLGAAFANMEMNVVLRTMLRDYTVLPTSEAAEKRHSRGITNGPARGGTVVVRRRSAQPAQPAQPAPAAAGSTTSGRTTTGRTTTGRNSTGDRNSTGEQR